jgi:hypothetical protein
MVNVHVDPEFGDEERRIRLFAGDVIVYTNVPEISSFVAFARNLITGAFAPDEPTTVHEQRSPAELADVLIEFKPRFIHHPDSIEHVRRIVSALGVSAELTYADVPKLRTAFPTGSLSTGIAYAFQPHRDTWYSAPAQQINWWMPVWAAAANNVMEFYPRWFGDTIPNSSSRYSYYQANGWRGHIKDFSGGTDTRVHPAPLRALTDREPRLCLVPPVGGIMLFSGDHLHATIPNTSSVTRYSIDFRTVHASDVHERRGAPVGDVECVGTSLRDFHRLTDGAGFTEADIAPYETDGADGLKVFLPSG